MPAAAFGVLPKASERVGQSDFEIGMFATVCGLSWFCF
jgi:hypothetical protein